MNFNLQVRPSTITQESVEGKTLVTKMELYIAREDIISAYEEDEIQYYITFRQMIFIYHYPYGYNTQMTDASLWEIYNLLKQREDIPGITFYLDEMEHLSPDDSYKRGHSVQINLDLGI